MTDESLISEFGDWLRAEAAERLSELPSGIPHAEDAALAEVMLGYLEEAGAVTEHDLCPHLDKGTKPCRIVGLSLPENSTRLEVFTSGSASDAFHQKFEALSKSVWCPGEEQRWFYERARGSYQVARNRFGSTPAKRRDFDRTAPKSQYFGKADLAKYLMTWWGEPHTVSKGAQKNYSAFMFGLRERMGDDWEPNRELFQSCVSKATVFRAAHAAVKHAKLKSCGANVVTYTVPRLQRSNQCPQDDAVSENRPGSWESFDSNTSCGFRWLNSAASK